MRHVLGARQGKDAQTFVFFALTFGTIFLLCGLAIDSGLLFLAKARLARSVDGASLAAVGNFNAGATLPGATPQTVRANVALIMRNFAVANYTDLGFAHQRFVSDYAIPTTATEQANPYTTTTGQTAYTYTYNFTDGTKDPGPTGNYRKYVEVVLTTGTGGQITSATCNARCPVGTFFIGLLGGIFHDLKVSASAVATRNPRLIMIVLDRSASMLSVGGGAYGLPQAVVQFLDFFDTTSDYIGIVSFGTNARLEMALTTNFINGGTNLLYDSYSTNASGVGVPGADPEELIANTDYDPNYAISGVRRFKFGGQTAADDGIRLGMEQLMANGAFNDPDVVKYMVIFTDGAWNQTRTLLAAPPYTNWTLGPTNTAPPFGSIVTNTATWSTNLALNTNLVTVPSLCPMPDVTNAIAAASQMSGDFQTLTGDHLRDYWQSTDGTNEPINGSPTGPFPTALEGAPQTITSTGTVGLSGTMTVYARNIDVWLPPGAVDYEYHNNAVQNIYVSDLTNPTQHINISQNTGDSNELVMPGYLVDGLFYDGLDMTYRDNSYYVHAGQHTYPRYKLSNYQEYFMWPDDGTVVATTADAANYGTVNPCTSLERELMFRNYPNLLTGFYINRADDPPSPVVGDVDPYTGVQRHLYGLGPYYPGSGAYWPFDQVGFDYAGTYVLTNAAFPDPDPKQSTGAHGGSRHASYTINMLSTNASPEWYGEWFYEGSSTNNVNTISSPSTNTISSLMTNATEWQNGAPSWVTTDFSPDMISDATHNTTVISNAAVWRPNTFIGSSIGQTNLITTAASLILLHNTLGGGSATGGYVIDGSGYVYANSMGYSGRPTHYFDFSQGKWVRIVDNHNTGLQAQPLGFWKAQEYAWHARALGVTIYTVGYGYLVSPSQQLILAQIANATNSTAGNPQGGTSTNFFYTNVGGEAIPYNSLQPIGQQFFATGSADISNDFYSIGQAINAALTQ